MNHSLNKKLVLNKSTLANLNVGELNQVRGGSNLREGCTTGGGVTADTCQTVCSCNNVCNPTWYTCTCGGKKCTVTLDETC